MTETNKHPVESKSIWPIFPIELKHYGAISVYIGFFSLLLSVYANSPYAILFSVGLISFGVGSLKRHPLIKRDYLENGQWFTTSYYYEHSYETVGGALQVIGFVAILISMILTIYYIII